MKTVMSPHGQRGFTLVELIMVIVIMGVIGGMVSVFMKSPIDAYIDSGRRAALTDTADTTMRRVARDIQRALPNSIRTPIGVPANQCVEFIPTKTGGRYRAEGLGALDFAAGATSFNMLGSNITFDGTEIHPDQQIDPGDEIVVYNLGIPGSDAYDASTPALPNNRTRVSLAALTESGVPVETTVPIDSKRFPLASGSNRFQVVSRTEQIVRYACVGASGVDAQGRGTGTLIRQVLSFPLPLASTTCPGSVIAAPVLATGVSSCSFDYSGTDLQRNALIRVTLQLTDSNETVTLLHEVHVNNTP